MNTLFCARNAAFFRLAAVFDIAKDLGAETVQYISELIDRNREAIHHKKIALQTELLRRSLAFQLNAPNVIPED